MNAAGANGVGRDGSSGAEVLAAAVALRFSRPDLAAALTDHLLEAAASVGDRDMWLLAGGWRVHAASATGDGREAASELLEAVP